MGPFPAVASIGRLPGELLGCNLSPFAARITARGAQWYAEPLTDAYRTMQTLGWDRQPGGRWCTVVRQALWPQGRSAIADNVAAVLRSIAPKTVGRRFRRPVQLVLPPDTSDAQMAEARWGVHMSGGGKASGGLGVGPVMVRRPQDPHAVTDPDCCRLALPIFVGAELLRDAASCRAAVARVVSIMHRQMARFDPLHGVYFHVVVDQAPMQVRDVERFANALEAEWMRRSVPWRRLWREAVFGLAGAAACAGGLLAAAPVVAGVGFSALLAAAGAALVHDAAAAYWPNVSTKIDVWACVPSLYTQQFSEPGSLGRVAVMEHYLSRGPHQRPEREWVIEDHVTPPVGDSSDGSHQPP